MDRRVEKTHRKGKRKVVGEVYVSVMMVMGFNNGSTLIPVAINYTSPGPEECFRFCIEFVDSAVSMTHHANNSCSFLLSGQARRSFKRRQ